MSADFVVEVRVAKVNWKDADGTVSSVMVSQGGRGVTFYTVGFSYKVDGHFYGGTITTGEEYREGDSVPVKYDPNDPERNDLMEKETRGRWILWAVIGVAVVMVLLVFGLSR
jgi:hypothetical protein